MKTTLTQKVLAKTQISLADYVINPYRGCNIGCFYCYANENKNSSPECAVKINAPEILEKELRFITPQRVLIGSTTECFQKEDAQFKVTENILKILNRKNIPYTILTKSHYIENYLDILAENKSSKIYFTFNFHDTQLIRAFEKNSSSLEQRIQAIEKLITYKIDLRIHAGPFIPGICDIEKLIALLPAGVKEMDIEVYHGRMGNISEILKISEQAIGSPTAETISQIYKTESDYHLFCRSLKEKLIELKTKNNISFYLIVPPYGEYYNPSTDYENTLI